MKQKAINYPMLVQRTDQTKKDGTNTLMLRIHLNGIKKDISLKVACKPSDFDQTKKCVKRSCADYEKINLLIEGQLKKAGDIIFKARIHDTFITIEEFISQFYGKQNTDSFIEFIRSEIDLEKKKGNKAIATVTKYGLQLNKLKRYKPGMRFHDLNENFIADFEQYMREQLKNKKNSSNNTLKFIRKFNRIAVDKGLTDKLPKYNIREEKNETVKFLMPDEFKKIKDYFCTLTKKHKHYKPLKSFLFSCYTGLRYGDNKKFTLNQIVNGSIQIITEKTGTFIVVPLLSEAKELLNYDIDPRLPNLGTPCDQTCNRALKEIAETCGINKRITTHYARHTFGGYAINKKMSLDVVRKIMGHTTSKQTDLYAKIWDSTLVTEMAKLEGEF
jgi:integrase/recombinase XerD